ncbi:MAG: alkaline phosphatase [Planctomycetes bacterium]|nr:alkaline phosphatase [Planctomycetota bacterium]
MRKTSIGKARLFLAALAVLLALPVAMAADSVKPPKYVFLFIGDGTSFPQRNAAEFFLANQMAEKNPADQVARHQKQISKDTGIADFKPNTQRLTMNTFPAQGISTTYSANSLIPDSSSSGTAIATGNKTRDGVVSMDPEGRVNYTSIAKIAKAKGKKVGVLTSVSLDHATPAVFYANQPNRNDYYEIALQAPASGFDYFAGGAFKQPEGKKGDQKSVFDVFQESGYTITKDRDGFQKLSAKDGKILAVNHVLDPDMALPYTLDRQDGEITLADFVKKGIEVLDNEDGFFMMTEGGKVDWACHANDALTAILDVIAFDEAVQVAYDFYKRHPDETLIVVTGDHETGGMTVGFAGTRYDTFLNRISKQKGSYITFNNVIDQMKKDNTNLTFESIMPTVTEFFGLTYYPDSERAVLEQAASNGDIAAIEKLAHALQPFEVDTIKKGLATTLIPAKDRPRQDDAYYKDYGSYEPLTVALTHVLNNKAGIAWTTFSHSGLPTPVSAIGVGAENFMGHYDNTDIFKKMVAIAY